MSEQMGTGQIEAGRIGRDRLLVRFAGAGSGVAPLTWGQKAIWQDMLDSGNQFSMGGMAALPEGSTVADAAALLSGLMSGHAALRMQLRTDGDGQVSQEIAKSGETFLDILTLPDDADTDEAERFAVDLMDTWPEERFDFQRDWPVRMAVILHRGTCVCVVWVLSHLAADGGGHLLFLADLLAAQEAGVAPEQPGRAQIVDIARNEQTPELRRSSSRTMRYWESQLRAIPAQTFGERGLRPEHQPEHRYWQARFRSPAAHLAMLAIARRTGTDASRVALALIVTAIARTAGANPLTIKFMINNRFRAGMADVIAPVAQLSPVTIDVADTTVDEVVARARSASLTAGMRAYYDPDDLRELMARLDAERGYPAAITCRVNDQRAMVMRAEGNGEAAEVSAEQISKRLPESTLTWIGPKEHMHEQANILIQNEPDVLALYILWDRWSLPDEQVEALLRAVEDVAVEAAFDPSAPTKVVSAGRVAGRA